jgi:hypothetical protein
MQILEGPISFLKMLLSATAWQGGHAPPLPGRAYFIFENVAAQWRSQGLAGGIPPPPPCSKGLYHASLFSLVFINFCSFLPLLTMN